MKSENAALKDLSLSNTAAPMSGLVWEFQVDDSTWSGMGADVAAFLTKSYQGYMSGWCKKVRCKTGIGEYLFDLDDMTQTNSKSQTLRKIRCRLDVPARLKLGRATRCISVV